MWLRETLEYLVKPHYNPSEKMIPRLDEGAGVSMNTRTLQKGDVFFALTGKQCDGHDYIEDAVSSGAAYIIAEHAHDTISAAQQITVKNAYEALTNMGRNCRALTGAHVIGITGSSGKTTVKDWCAHILRSIASTVWAEQSFNNDIGVPYSLACLKPHTRFGVFEIGMNHPGEIEPLAVMMRPHSAVITSISASHIGHMGSIEAIAEEKSEIFRGMDTQGVAIIPRDCHYFSILHAKAESFNIKNIFTFGAHPDAHARLIEYSHTQDGGHAITAVIQGQHVHYNIKLMGEHAVMNSLAVMLACASAGAALDDVLKRIATFDPPVGRGRRYVLQRSDVQGDYFTLVDDSYNANPSSMRMGLVTFSRFSSTHNQIKAKRKIAILGSMKELGEHTQIYHESIGHTINTLPIDQVFTVGDEMADLFRVLSPEKQGGHFDGIDDLVTHIMNNVAAHDSIFIKGSKSSNVSKVVKTLLDYYQPEIY